jgi:hypothetical protein
MRAGLNRFTMLGDLVHFLCLGLRSRASLAVENLFLRKQLGSIKSARSSPACRQSDPADAGIAESLVQLARSIDHRPAQDLRHLAPQRLPPLLALEVRSWPAADSG